MLKDLKDLQAFRAKAEAKINAEKRRIIVKGTIKKGLYF